MLRRAWKGVDGEWAGRFSCDELGARDRRHVPPAIRCHGLALGFRVSVFLEPFLEIQCRTPNGSLFSRLTTSQLLRIQRFSTTDQALGL